MKKSIIHILLVISIWGGMYSKGICQQPDELFKLAIEANQELQSLKFNYQAALEKAPQLRQLSNPEVGLGVFILPVETRLGPQQARISATQMFPWFGTLKAKEDWALKEARARFERIAAAELEIQYRLSMAYFELYKLQASRRIIQQNITLFESLISLAETKVAAGKSTIADVLRLNLRIDDLNQRLRVLENRKRKPTAEINQLLHRELTIPVSTADSLTFTELNFNKDTLLAQVALSHPMLRMYEIQQEAANAAIGISNFQAKPSFGIGADYINIGQRNDAFPNNNGRDAFQVRASISIPLYREKYKAKQREEKLRINSLEATKQENLSKFREMIEKAYTDHDEARLNLSLYIQQIETTRTAIEVLRAQYAGQSSNFDDLLQLEVALLDYDLRKLQSVVESHMAKAAILRYLP